MTIRNLTGRPALFRVLLITAAAVFFTTAITAQKNGKPTPCSKPAVAPPDTSCAFGSGCLDQGFNGNGFAVFDQLGAIRDVSSGPDGKIVAVGEGWRPNSTTGRDVLLMRFNADGTPDTTFGEVDISNPLLRTGQTHISVTSGNEFVQAGAVQPDGKIVAAGWAATGVWWVVRTMPDGSPDPSFDGDGIRTLARTGGVWDMKVQPDGKILLGSDTNFTITRLNVNGSLDTSFGSGGTAVHNAGSSKGKSQLWSIALQRVSSAPTEDRIVIGGWSTTSANGTSSFGLMRLRSNGSVDTTFGSAGKVTTNFFSTGDQVREIAIDASNRIVAGGITRINSCSATDFAVARYSENGTLDATFGTQGKVSLDLYNDENSVYALAIQSDGKVIVGGNARVLANDAANRRYYATLVRLDTAGNRDNTFGTGSAGPGVVTTMFSGASLSTFVFSLYQQADGKILAAGVSQEKPALVRYFQ